MKIAIIDGHPNKSSFTSAILDSYIKGAKTSSHEIKRINIRDLNFSCNLEAGYQRIQDLEPDLKSAQSDILWCEHLILAYPIWWGQMPAILKGFVDRTMLPGFAFKYHKNDPWWDRLLSGRSARLILTSDAPKIYNWLAYGNAPIKVSKKMILEFCGFKPVKTAAIGNIKNLNEVQRAKVLKKFYHLGLQSKFSFPLICS